MLVGNARCVHRRAERRNPAPMERRVTVPMDPDRADGAPRDRGGGPCRRGPGWVLGAIARHVAVESPASAPAQTGRVGTRERTVDAASRRSKAAVAAVGEEIRRARLEHGLSQAAVGAAAGVSRSQVSRIERGGVLNVSVRVLARLAAAVGLDLSVRAYPGGEPIRDAPHVALLRRLRAAVGNGWAWRAEVPVGPEGDQRAWDAVLARREVRVAVEAETRVRDFQALVRRVALKQRDSGVASVLLLLTDTRWNRRIVREFAIEWREAFPVDRRRALASLSAGEDPGGNAIVLL